MEDSTSTSPARPFQCKVCLDHFGSRQSLWLHQQQHHTATIIFVCPHCDTALPPKNKNTPSDKVILGGKLLKCPSCSRQEHPFSFVRHQTAFACGFCSQSFFSSPSPSSSAADDSTTAGNNSSSSPSSNSGSSSGLSFASPKQARRHYFAHLVDELRNNDKLIKHGKPPVKWVHTSVIEGLLQRPGIVKHWEADGTIGACKAPPGAKHIKMSWTSDKAMAKTDGTIGTNMSLQNQLQFFDLDKDGDEKAAWLAKLAFEQADKIFVSETGRVVAKHQGQVKNTGATTTTCVGNKGQKDDCKKMKKSSTRLNMNKPLPKLPTRRVATVAAATQTIDFAYLASTASTAATSPSSSSIVQQPQAFKSTDRQMKGDKRRSGGESKTKRKVRAIVQKIEMAVAGAYC
ncbi:hypothetical protein B0T20DRAFT_80460 [Sordaria brevicollis]|uniref:C2H2-type domain-containing protein n=1 Tax=Sordaria brevicollis TaxID=83679 RepID=A0AAE0P189_SORBR|nr:hypothetical protein B0T20DRAFT_80460 [Sordaria brevicollis]